MSHLSQRERQVGTDTGRLRLGSPFGGAVICELKEFTDD